MNLDDIQKYVNEQIRAAQSGSIHMEIARILELAKTIIQSWNNGGKLAIVGNGGSAAEAMHIAAEFTGKCIRDHRPLPALCLNESQSSITAVGNDYGFEFVFARQIRALLNSKDILICLSTSGKSLNIVKAIEEARDIGVDTYLWTGKKAIEYPGTTVWNSINESTPRIQEEHLLWGHLLSEIIELSLIDG